MLLRVGRRIGESLVALIRYMTICLGDYGKGEEREQSTSTFWRIRLVGYCD